MKRNKTALPGFHLTMGYTLFYLILIVLIPLSAIILKSSEIGPSAFIQTMSEPRVLQSLKLSFGASFIAASINAIFGTLAAWVLTRYKFPGRKLIDTLIDLPFALPTAIAGISLTTLYAQNGWLGKPLEFVGIKVAFALPGIVIAMIFVGIPFVIRTVQPILENLNQELEEAASILGATRFQCLYRIVFPTLIPSILTGFSMAFARAVGEYGSVVFIAGNLPMKTEIVPLLIISKLEQYDYKGATALSVVMLCISFSILFIINLLERWSSQRNGEIAS